MKKFYFLLSVIFVCLISIAQIPNSGFENWENYVDDYTGYNYEKPDLWVGSLPNNLIYSFSIEKNNESYPPGTGQYSMKIQPDIANGVRGVAISNDSADPMVNWIPKPSFPINQRPASLYLYYKCLPFGGDTIICMVYFYKDGIVIGNPTFGTTETVSNWTELEIPMTYFTSDVPDSATILFVTGAYVQHSESTLYIDNLSFDGFVTGTNEPTQNNLIELYPNPASTNITINTKELNEDVRMEIYNMNGNKIKVEHITQVKQTFSIEDLCDGIYILKFISKEINYTQKLIVQR